MGFETASADTSGSHIIPVRSPPATLQSATGQECLAESLGGKPYRSLTAGKVFPTQPLIISSQQTFVSVCADTFLQLKEFFAERNGVGSNVLLLVDLQCVLADCGFQVTLEALEMFFGAFGSESGGCISFQELMAVFHSPPTPALMAPPALGCARDGKMVDTQFPPTRDSIFGMLNSHTEIARGLLAATGGGQIEWVRADMLSSCRSLFHNVHPNDLADGVVGDGCLLGGLACLAESEGRMFHIIQEKSSSPIGQYSVRIFDARCRQWESVVVDDNIPVFPGTRHPLLARPQGNEMWVLIVEKALAKWFGSYAQCQRMHCLFPLMLLTDTGPCRVFVQRRVAQVYNEDLYCIDQVSVSDARSRDGVQSTSLGQCAAEQVWLELRIADNRSFLGVVWTDKGASGQKIADGIVRDRLYTILEVVQVSAHGQVWRTIRLRNPWASDSCAEWRGALSESWSRWPELSDLRQELAIGSSSLDGSFWMTWDDFRARFSHISVVPKEMEVPRLGRVEPWAPTPACGARHHKRFQRPPAAPPAFSPITADLSQASGSASQGIAVRAPRSVVGLVLPEMEVPEEASRRPAQTQSLARPASARAFASPRDPRFDSMARGLSAAAQCALNLGVSQDDFVRFASETFSQLQAQSMNNTKSTGTAERDVP